MIGIYEVYTLLIKSDHFFFKIAKDFKFTKYIYILRDI